MKYLKPLIYFAYICLFRYNFYITAFPKKFLLFFFTSIVYFKCSFLIVLYKIFVCILHLFEWCILFLMFVANFVLCIIVISYFGCCFWIPMFQSVPTYNLNKVLLLLSQAVRSYRRQRKYKHNIFYGDTCKKIKLQ